MLFILKHVPLASMELVVPVTAVAIVMVPISSSVITQMVVVLKVVKLATKVPCVTKEIEHKTHCDVTAFSSATCHTVVRNFNNDYIRTLN